MIVRYKRAFVNAISNGEVPLPGKQVVIRTSHRSVNGVIISATEELVTMLMTEPLHKTFEDYLDYGSLWQQENSPQYCKVRMEVLK